MAMRFRGLAVLALAAAALAGAAAPAEERMGLKVLYAGNPGSGRAKDFTAFLEKHFAKVGATDFGKFKEEEARDYDVVIFDWTSIYARDKNGKINESGGNIAMPPGPRLSQDFARPAILIGAAGGEMANGLGIKINWL
jgi:hypothetical protein